MENGLDVDVDELERFLAAWDDQPLPEPVEAFFKRCRRQADAVRPAGAAVVFECCGAKTAAEIAEHPETGKLCRRTFTRIHIKGRWSRMSTIMSTSIPATSRRAPCVSV